MSTISDSSIFLSSPPMSAHLRPTKWTWTSRRRLLHRHISDLHRCSNPRHLKELQAQIFRSNLLHQDPSIAPKLIAAYSHTHLLPLALAVFALVPAPTTLLFNALIRALSNSPRHHHAAFSAFIRMLESDVLPDNFTFPFLLKACSGRYALEKIQMVHSHVVRAGFIADIYIPNSLINSYSRVGNAGIAAAKRVFDEMPSRDLVSWNSMVAGLCRAGELGDARRMFDEMAERDTVSWNTMLDGHVKAGEMERAFELFERMPERNVVSWSTMVSGYCKKGEMDMARVLFDRMPRKNLVPWTIIISGYAEKGFAKEALILLDQMEEVGLEPDAATSVSILAACAESGLHALGKRLHSCIKKSEVRFTVQVCNALVDMYSKCGNLDTAMSVFEEMRERDLVSWNSMIQGLANHGRGDTALDLFDRMIEEGIKPDGVTFVGVLCACAHVGLVEEARHYFASMERDFEILPQIEHYGCMIDVLSRRGLIQEALDMVKTMPFEPNAIIWGTILGGCRVHNNIDLAEEVVSQLVRLEPSDAGNYAILSNIYAAAGRWDGMAKARIGMKGHQKPTGSSWIEVDDSVHEFSIQDIKHPQSYRVFKMVDRLGEHLKQVDSVQMSIN